MGAWKGVDILSVTIHPPARKPVRHQNGGILLSALPTGVGLGSWLDLAELLEATDRYDGEVATPFTTATITKVHPRSDGRVAVQFRLAPRDEDT